MKPRVCIFAAETLLHWSAYYVKAFRQVADVVVIGPQFRPEEHDYPDWDRVSHCLVKNDIYSDSTDAIERLALLPEGWDPTLVVRIQSGDDPLYRIGGLGCPTVYISVDTWHAPSEYKLAHQYDFVFVAQKALAKYMRLLGCCRVFWLPLGCDPEAHYLEEGAPERFDIAFVGTTHFVVNRQRRARLKVLEDHFRLGVFFGCGPEDMASAYGQSRLIFNASIACDVNMRVFEALATGRPLVTNREAEANGLFELFEDGVDLITYDDADMVDQVQRYLDDPEAARAIGARGKARVLAEHTYRHRVEQVFATLRAHHAGILETAYPRLQDVRQVRDFIPCGTTRLLDVGLGVRSSRVALRRRGIQHVAGIAWDPESQAKRANSYDTIWRVDNLPVPTGDFDAVLCTPGAQSGHSLDGLLEFAKGWLVPGGRLLLGVAPFELAAVADEGDTNALSYWFAARGYQLLTRCRLGEGEPYQLIAMATVEATLDGVNQAMYREFPVNGTNAEPWNGVMGEEESGSPDAGDP